MGSRRYIRSDVVESRQSLAPLALVRLQVVHSQ
jgi:hypothetical protein